MSLSANQPKRGTQHGSSPADEVKRTGRDSGVVTPAKGYTEHGKSAGSDVESRTGRNTGTLSDAQSLGIGRGNADKGGSDGVSGIPDGVGGPLPSAK
jgi:hypothetical protein